jgi:histidinol-phosphate aminotransferase
MAHKKIETYSAFNVADIKAKSKMDQNEAPFDVDETFKKKILDFVKKQKWNLYPQPKLYYNIKKKFAEQLNIPAENIFLTAGQDQVIYGTFLLSKSLFSKNKTVIFEPTYPMFQHFAKILGIDYDIYNLGADYQILKKYFKTKYSLINIITPNNPTGNLINKDLINWICKNNKNSIIFIDEAYCYFAEQNNSDFFKKYNNVIIGRSLSKIQLAGVRCGYGIGSPGYVKQIENILLVPYNLNYFQFALFNYYGTVKKFINKSVNIVNKEKQKIYSFFQKNNIKYKKSYGNFVMFEVDEPNNIYNNLLKKGIKLRNVSKLPGLKKYLRLTVRSEKENNYFLTELKKILH